MSGLFKDALRGRHCASDQPVKEAMHARLVSQILEHYSHRVPFCVLYSSQRAYRLLTYATLTDWCFITKMERVYCAVRRVCLNNFRLIFFCKGLILVPIYFAFRPVVSIVRVNCELESTWKEMDLIYFKLLLLLLLGYLVYSKKLGSKTCWIWSKNFNNSSPSFRQVCFCYPDLNNSGSHAEALYMLKKGRPCLLFCMFRRCERKYDKVRLYKIWGFRKVSGEYHGRLGYDAVFLVIC